MVNASPSKGAENSPSDAPPWRLLQIQRAWREHFLKGDTARAEALFVDVLGDGFEHLAVSLDAIGHRVGGERATHLVPDQARLEMPEQGGIAGADDGAARLRE